MDGFIPNLVQPNDLEILGQLPSNVLLRGWQQRRKLRDPGTKLQEAADTTARFIVYYCMYIGAWVSFTREDLSTFVDMIKNKDMPDPRQSGTRPISILDFLTRWHFLKEQGSNRFQLTADAIEYLEAQATALREKSSQ